MKGEMHASAIEFLASSWVPWKKMAVLARSQGGVFSPLTLKGEAEDMKTRSVHPLYAGQNLSVMGGFLLGQKGEVDISVSAFERAGFCLILREENLIMVSKRGVSDPHHPILAKLRTQFWKLLWGSLSQELVCSVSWELRISFSFINANGKECTVFMAAEFARNSLDGVNGSRIFPGYSALIG